jgi:hypothetical protein
MGNQTSNRKTIQRSGGFFQDFANRFRLIGRLMLDSRVNPFLKILPVGTLVYVLSPVDILSLNPVDDAFVIWVGTTLFVELCPPNVVQEHMAQLNGLIQSQGSSAPSQQPFNPDDVIDGEFIDTDTSGRGGTSPR